MQKTQICVTGPQCVKFLIMPFSQASSYFLSGANILLSTLLPNTLNLLSSFRVRDQISNTTENKK
jgi:hypothetical protein